MDFQEGEVKHIAGVIVKGCGMIEADEAYLDQSGLRLGHYGDHEYMLVRAEPDADGVRHFVSQRDNRYQGDKPQSLSSMALIKPVLDGDGVRLTWNYSSDGIDLPYDNDSGEVLAVEVQHDICQAVDQGDALAKWFGEHLDVSLRVVKAAGPFYRLAEQIFMKNSCNVRFHDRYPGHWFTDESVAELSRIAGYDIPWQTFRPQIVATGMDPQYEHNVYSGDIAGINFVNPKPCGRCIVTNVNQNTAEVQEGRALTHLGKYKRWHNTLQNKKPTVFGENMLILGSGPIRKGNKIRVHSERNPPLVFYGSKV